jgi:hypothetical protein
LKDVEGPWSFSDLELMLPEALRIRYEEGKAIRDGVLGAIGVIFSKEVRQTMEDLDREMEESLRDAGLKNRGLDPLGPAIRNPGVKRLAEFFDSVEAIQEQEAKRRPKGRDRKGKRRR